MFEHIRTGAWLTPQRLRVYPLILLVGFVIAGLGLVVTAHDGRDAYGHTLGADFSEIWTAGHEVDHGQPARPYDVPAYRLDQEKLFGKASSFYVWLYPPFFLAVAGVLALAPYGAAFVLWQGSTLALYLGAMFAALQPARLPSSSIILGALAFPAAFANLIQGQNGFLTAALFGGGLVLLRHRPLAAGLCFALLAYKPHLGLLIVPALIAGGHWRALASGAVGLSFMAIASLAAFGYAPWAAFFAHLDFSRALLEAGAPGFGKLVSPFAAVRLLGGSVALAYAIQSILTLALILAVIIVWRAKAEDHLKAALLMAASLIATPYAFDYDMVVLGPALAFALCFGLQHGFRSYEKSGLALIWLMPLLARPVATKLLFPLGPLIAMLFVAGLVARAAAKSTPGEPMPAGRAKLTNR